MKYGERKEESKDLYVNPYSTWLNPGTSEFQQVKDWILTTLGYPLVSIEVTDSQLCAAMANAMRIFTKYYYNPPKYLILDLFFYKQKKHIVHTQPETNKEKVINDTVGEKQDENTIDGLDLSMFDINEVRDIGFQRDNMMGYGMDMFFSPYAYFGQGGFGPMFGMGNGNSVGAWTTWHNMNEWFDVAKRMTGSNPFYVYDHLTKHLRIMPEPRCGGKFHRFICATVFQEPPIERILGEDTFLRLALAETKMIVGTVRKKFSGTQLLGGATIDTEIYNEGKDERDKLVDELQKTDGIGQCFYLS